MAIRIRNAAAIANKWKSRASAAGGDYAEGVRNPNRDQAEAAAAAAGTWAAGVQQAIGDNRFAEGVTRAGSARWRARSESIGAQRYPQGVGAAQAEFQNGVAPFLQVLEGLELPPRMPRGDPGNVARVAAVAQALRTRALQR